MKITFNTPATVTVSKRNGASVDVDVKSLPEETLANLLAYGIKQKVADASSGEPTEEGSQAAMAACVAKLVEGEWSLRGEGATADPLDRFRLAIIREQLGKPNNEKMKEGYDAIPSDDQKARREYLLAIATKNAEVIDPIAQARLDAEQAAKREASAISIAV